jgi:hypothetical protein
MNATRTVAITALAAGLATTACSASSRPPATVISVVAPQPAPTATPDKAPIGTNLPSLHIDAPNPKDPTGTPVDFAIRYLNDLRADHWNAAINQMGYMERAEVDLARSADIVGLDVLRNASRGTGQLARCTSGNQFATDAVIVRCGRRHVVVHIETRRGFRGVDVSGFFVPGDHPGQPHTHAYTHLV